MGPLVTTWFTKLAARTEPGGAADVKCDDKSSCASGTTCCRLQSGEWGCCPVSCGLLVSPQAVCCEDHEHCCPQGYTCNMKTKTCPQVLSWSSGSQQVLLRFSSGSHWLSSCLQAVCCGGSRRCCPGGFSCNLKAGPSRSS
uniref:Granulins domain-containing protein n=1 Tax=Kryptolebias marmoratus TaxID=37003 RepID=A0A3Q3BG16_KRYMA